LDIIDNDLEKFIEGLLKSDFNEREAEVLRKINMSREEKQLWKKTIEWTRQSIFFGNIQYVRGMMQLENKEGKAKTYYSSNSIPWWIHKYWASPKVYLNERLQTIRRSQSLMFNIYSAFITTFVFGLLIFWLNSIKDLFFVGHLIYGILNSIVFLISIRLLLHYKKSLNEWIRKIFIIGSINNLDIESYIISSIIAERKC